jgi:putative ABC transport system permease protein
MNRPLISALWRNPSGAILVAIQIAVALAVLVNASYIVKQRLDKIGRPTGIDVANIFVIESSGFTAKFDYLSSVREDLQYLRSIPGVVAATPVNKIPLSGSGSGRGLLTTPDGDLAQSISGNYSEMDHQSIATLGVQLSAGRPFREDEVRPAEINRPVTTYFPQIIVSQGMARALFPNENALGKTVYDGLRRPITIIGVIEHMQGSWLSHKLVEQLYIAPLYPPGPAVKYLVRTQAGRRDLIMQQVERSIVESNPNRIIERIRPLEEFKNRSYLADRNMGIFLVSITALLLVITALGVFGLATFHVNARTKQIGTRRAVGARRLDIVLQFMVENWLITTAGVLIGSGLSLGAGVWLSLTYQLPRLDLYYLVGGGLVIWALGLLAAWHPARRAACVSPAVATRTV